MSVNKLSRHSGTTRTATFASAGLPAAMFLMSTKAHAQEVPPLPAPPPSDTTTEAAAAPEPTATPALPTASEPKWYDTISLGAFVDTYYSQNWQAPRPNQNANRYHAFEPNTGFSLAWVGVDASMEPAPVGATIQLRFGPSVPNLTLADFNVPGGIGYVQNGYVSWRPEGKDGKLTLILGKFDTIYGAEVAPSQLNINYTRGALYNLAQPFFHTGLRADYVASDQWTFKVLVANGWNNTLDNNRGKSLGAQASYTPVENATFSLGYMGGPEEDDVKAVAALPAGMGAVTQTANTGAEGRWRHLVDAIADVKVTPALRVVANADYVTQSAVDATSGTDKTVRWYGAAVYGRYAISDMFAGAVRGEWLRDDDGQLTRQPLTLWTGTLTLEAAVNKYLLIRLDNRADVANESVFQKGLSDTSKTQFTSTLGVVAKTS